jgi:hypothetical protein
MPTYQIAYVRERTIDGHDVYLIVVPMQPSFGQMSPDTQRQTEAELQLRASATGLPGVVCLVWDAGAGRMGFIAPTTWHAYFQSLDMQRVMANVNRTLYW